MRTSFSSPPSDLDRQHIRRCAKDGLQMEEDSDPAKNAS